jgi:hypothetical protein
MCEIHRVGNFLDYSKFLDGIEEKDIKIAAKCQVLSFDYENLVQKSVADVVLVLVQKWIYLYRPKDSSVVDDKRFDRFCVDEIAMMSLPYSEEEDQIARRLEDFALHLHDCKTLWLRCVGIRSDVVQTISDMYTVEFGGHIEVNSYEYLEILRRISDLTIRGDIKEIKFSQFAHQKSSLIQGWLKYSAWTLTTNVRISEWQTRWFYLSRHDLWHFSSPEDVDAFKFALSLPKSRRASLPLMGRISIPLKSFPSPEHLESGFSISISAEDLRYVFIPIESSASSWIQSISNRSS